MATAYDSQRNTSFNANPYKHSDVYKIDITGWDDNEVVELLTSIVNGKLGHYRDSSVFKFKITPPNKCLASRFFQLRPKPTNEQPGNGRISYLLKWYDTNEKVQHTLKLKHAYKDLSDLLTKTYTNENTGKEKTHHFAQDIKKVFKDNTVIYNQNFPSATAEAYMLLLFEIARRRVTTSNSDLDKLPIRMAISGLVKLLEAEKCTFKDVFLKRKGRFHCFSDDYKTREEAVSKINEAHDKLFTDKQQDKGGWEDEAESADEDESEDLQEMSV